MLITPNQATLIGAFGGAILGAVIGGVVSFVVARYIVEHGANYSGQIETINRTLASLAATQEEMKQHYAQSVADERTRHEEAGRRAEAERWKPEAWIESKVEGVEQVNSLILKAPERFYLSEAALIAPGGAKLLDYPVANGVSTTGFRVPITQSSLNKVVALSPTYFEHETFSGSIRYRVQREKDGVTYTNDIPFHGEHVLIQNTGFYKLSG